ncbi:conserved hypothetical protein [gamma proteobacterium NOR5-3]|nr:conserved hypothetical protein [gamma proteobacterium NOR5-3]
MSATSESTYNEQFLQELMYRNPSCLPINEIDGSYSPLIPVCMELQTPAGPLDILYVTPSGKLAIVEAKLWRNPEARRKVIGQILDYAKELSKWSYEDLQREVSKATGTKGNQLYNLVAAQYPDTVEREFCDAVSRSLSIGQFLLVIAGDGIREGAGAIANFIERSGNLAFTFGMVELAIYQHPNARCQVQPRVLAKTAVIKRTIVTIEDGAIRLADDEPSSLEAHEDSASAQRSLYSNFWSDFNASLQLDDTSQPIGTAAKAQNYYLYMPPDKNQAWLSAYFQGSQGKIGVYLRFARNGFGDVAYPALLAEKDQIEKELGAPVEWRSKDGQHSVVLAMPLEDPTSESNLPIAKAFFADTLNKFCERISA